MPGAVRNFFAEYSRTSPTVFSPIANSCDCAATVRPATDSGVFRSARSACWSRTCSAETSSSSRPIRGSAADSATASVPLFAPRADISP